MSTIILRLDARNLTNPDLDLRYVLPDLLAERSGGVLTDDGYDYAQDANYLLVFLKTADVEKGLSCIIDVLENVRVLGNDLRRSVVVAVEKEGRQEVVYPAGFQGSFAV